MPRRLLLPILAALVAAAPAHAAERIAAGAPHRSGEVLVVYKGKTKAERVGTREGETVSEAIARLRADPDVVSANANYIARITQATAPEQTPTPTPSASAAPSATPTPAPVFIPDDPGRSGQPGGWQAVQWNFLHGTGVNAPAAWRRLIDLKRPGALGVKVAVLDTGVAYADRGRYRRSPDLSRNRFIRGYDFVDDDPYPNDENGHGTHVASTIGESTGNGIGLTGLAYNARIMPVRVLDADGEGDAAEIAAGIRFAAGKGVRLINLSFEFTSTVTADQIPDILSAIRAARRKGAIVIGASGNEARGAIAYPARSEGVLAVGAVTESGCEADYSNDGPGLDLVAPGGGGDADITDGPEACNPASGEGRDIYQVTLTGSALDRFGIPSGYVGTSMAAPHVTGVAALVLASGIIGEKPSPGRLEQHLKATARDLGRPGRDRRYGSGLVDAGAAVGATPVIRQR